MFNRIISITLILILAVIAFTGCDRSADSSYKEVIKYNVPIKPDKIFDNLSEPDIINDR